MDYSNGKIYKIVCNTTGKCYIGSTCQPLSQRLAQHRFDYQRFLNGKRNYITSFEIIEKGNYDIILLEMFPCNCKEELHARERYYIENLECVNKYIPNRTKKEYRDDNKDIISEQKKEYYENNKDKINEKHKEYYEQNKDKKDYYEQNKDIINAKYTCDCGGKYTKQNKSIHLKTNLHQEYLLKTFSNI